MEEECELDENMNTLTAFTVLVICIALLSAISTYLHYGFPEGVAKACFIILIISIFIDLLITRILLCLIWSL
jgi:hypothetical protein